MSKIIKVPNGNYHFITGYQKNDLYRHAFNDLAVRGLR